MVCSLFDVQDVSFATALEVTAGGRLYNVVVDNENTAKKLLEKGQLQSRVTFIPLNKIEGRTIDDRTTAAAVRVAGKENCHTAISLIGFDHQLAPAMKFIFGSSFVCRNIEEARKVTFHEQILRKTVTLDGDVVDPAGTLTGGSRASGASLLVKLNELKQYRNEFESKSRQLNEAVEELKSMELASGQYRTLKQRYDVKKHEFELLQQRLQQTLHHRQTQEVENMKTELQTAEEKATECQTIITQGKLRIKELEDQVKNASQIREKQLKAAQAELERCKKKAAASQAKWKEHANDADSLKLELEELRKSIETTEVQLQGVFLLLRLMLMLYSRYTCKNICCFFLMYLETEAALVKLQEEMTVLNQALVKEQEKVNEIRQQIESFKEQMAKQNLEISKRLAGKEQRETQVIRKYLTPQVLIIFT